MAAPRLTDPRVLKICQQSAGKRVQTPQKGRIACTDLGPIDLWRPFDLMNLDDQGADGFPLGITARVLLEAMAGIVYLADRGGMILAVGQRGWAQFAAENAVPWLTVDAMVGTSLFDAIHSDPVRDAYRRLHDAVATGRRTETVFEYRCDAPMAERHMHMAISAVRGQDGVVAVLYQSQMLAEVRRPPLPLFSAEHRLSLQRPAPPERIVALCSFCQRVAWPPGARPGPRRWISAAEFYRRGGPSDVAVSDGICPPCIKRLVTPNV